MPYSKLSELPDNVKKLPEDKQRQWMAVFNSAYKSCIDEGGNKKKCEPSAFAQAWGVVNKEESRMPDINLLTKKEEPSSRAKNLMEYIFLPIDQAVRAKDPNAWLNDVYADEETGDLFAIITSNGKIYKASVTLGADAATIGEWIECKLDFPTIPQETRLIKQADGKTRWLSIAGSSVINRNGQIDSRELFHSFVKNIEETGNYPVRQFCHCGMAFTTGQADFVAVDDNLLLMSGVYNDTELAKREIEAREEDNGYWGESIGFLPTAPPSNFEIEKGVTIPVYREGILVEESTVPEHEAGALFTSTIILEEVNRMLEKRQMDALVKIFGGDEDAAKNWLEKNVDEVNRQIADNGLITLAIDPAVETPVIDPAVSPDPEAVVENAIGDPPPPADETPPPAEDKPAKTVEVDEDTIKAIGDYIIGEIDTKIAEAIKPLVEAISGIQGRMTETENQLTEFKKYQDRLSKLETNEEERKRIWLEDAPPHPTVRVTHRPRTELETPATPVITMADVAAETLEKMGIK